MTAERVLNELVSEGWFQKGENGWHRAAAAPRIGRGLERFVYLVKALGVHSVSLRGIPAPIEVQTGTGVDGLVFRASKVIEK